jgi:hypothetical protein
MLFKIDSLFGHVIEETADGVVYQADGVLVDGTNLRPCVGCKVKCSEGSHDPCIANLPGTLNACCGHGLDVTPVHHNPNGYVALEDGRTFRFSGLFGGARIRQAVEAALKGEALPEGFAYDERKAWWTGLTDLQRQYVHDNTARGLATLVTAVTKREPSPLFLKGEAMWWDGLNEEEKAQVWARTGKMIDALVREALIQANLHIA